MNRRHQVFVSSTFEDLREERSAVISTLLQIDCFPAGMELFPASDEDSWTLIKRVIDDSDFYLVIVAGRYGSLETSSGKAYTHLEYEYAIQTGKPTIALLHSNPASLPGTKLEQSETGRQHLSEFCAELKRKNCRQWADRSELVLGVFTGIQQLKKSRPSDGWIKGSKFNEDAWDELLRLRRQVDDLNTQLAAARDIEAPRDTSEFAQGDAVTQLSVRLASAEFPAFARVSWRDIVRTILPHTFESGASDLAIASTLADLVRENHPRWLKFGVEAIVPLDWTIPGSRKSTWADATIPRSEFGKVMNQLVALGLVEPRDSTSGTMWVATRYGLREGSKQVAIKTGECRGNSVKPSE